MSSKITQVLICGIFSTTKVENACSVIAGSQYSVVCKQVMQVGKLAWPSLDANWARTYGKISPITLWALDLKLGGIFSLDVSHRD